MKLRFVTAMLCAGVVCFAGSVAFAGKKEVDYKKHPGYVDFAALEMFANQEAKVEVYLKTPLLKLAADFTKSEDPELYEILSKLKLVRVLVYDIDSKLARELADASARTAKDLDGRGWERIVRVREESERVDIYLRPSDKYESIEGIAVMVVSEDDEAIFVNIVGEIHPDDISRLGEHFDIDELGDVDYHRKKKGR